VSRLCTAVRSFETDLLDGQAGRCEEAREPALRETPVEQHVQRAPAEVLPWAHTVISNLKAWLIGTFHGVSHKQLDCYLKEFIYRFNRRWNEDKLFYYLTRRAAEATPFPYHRLIAEPIG